MYSLIELPTEFDQRGNLTHIESNRTIPFDILRVYYLHGVPNGAERGGHAHRHLQQLLIPVSGSLEVLLDNGVKKELVKLSKPNVGLYVQSMVWRELIRFEANTVCVVLASDHYLEADYIRDYNQFLQESALDR